MDKDSYNLFNQYKLIAEKAEPSPIKNQNSVGNLVGATGGGEGGNWGGSLPKLISLLPPGNWYAGSQKRSKVKTKSGGVSDHYVGNATAYGADFGLGSTFNNNKENATKFAIAVAKNTGANVTSWDPYVGKSFNYYTPDSFRVQIIWLSNVGGNHYDHVHVGVRRGSGTNTNMPPDGGEPYSSDTLDDETPSLSEDPAVNQAMGSVQNYIKSALGSDFSAQGLKKALTGTLGAAFGAIANPSGFLPKTK